ncbi:hypothetical protein [Saccharopolyspora pogona]|nr:hypothetical protein [Saccharopolyspora pogona]
MLKMWPPDSVRGAVASLPVTAHTSSPEKSVRTSGSDVTGGSVAGSDYE